MQRHSTPPSTHPPKTNRVGEIKLYAEHQAIRPASPRRRATNDEVKEYKSFEYLYSPGNPVATKKGKKNKHTNLIK